MDHHQTVVLPTADTCVLGIAAMNGVVAGIAAGSSGALAANVLPSHPVTGQPLNAARDMMIIGSMTMVTGAVVPTILGHVFVLFNSKVTAYRSFFLAAAAIHFFSVCLLFKVHPAEEKQRAAAAEAARASQGSLSKALLPSVPLIARSAPIGARLCDRFLWRGGHV